MLGMTRRGFIGGSAAIAGAAALGIKIGKDFREYGPVDLKLFLFSDKPYIIRASLYVDKQRGRFGIRGFDNDSGVKDARFSLFSIRHATVSMKQGRCLHTSVRILNKDGSAENVPIALGTDGKHLIVKLGDGNRYSNAGTPAPLLIGLEDVRRVI